MPKTVQEIDFEQLREDLELYQQHMLDSEPNAVNDHSAIEHVLAGLPFSADEL